MVLAGTRLWYPRVPKRKTGRRCADRACARRVLRRTVRLVPIRTTGESVVADDRNAVSGSAQGEQLADVGRGITLCYERIGDPQAEPLLLIAGLGQQLHTWPDGFCQGLADRGFGVVRFDNRDVGRSTHMAYKPPNPVAMFR